MSTDRHCAQFFSRRALQDVFSLGQQPAVGRVLNEAGGRNPRLANGTDGLGGDGIGVVDGGVFDEILGEDGHELASEREKVLIFDTCTR